MKCSLYHWSRNTITEVFASFRGIPPNPPPVRVGGAGLRARAAPGRRRNLPARREPALGRWIRPWKTGGKGWGQPEGDGPGGAGRISHPIPRLSPPIFHEFPTAAPRFFSPQPVFPPVVHKFRPTAAICLFPSPGHGVPAGGQTGRRRGTEWGQRIGQDFGPESFHRFHRISSASCISLFFFKIKNTY